MDIKIIAVVAALALVYSSDAQLSSRHLTGLLVIIDVKLRRIHPKHSPYHWLYAIF